MEKQKRRDGNRSRASRAGASRKDEHARSPIPADVKKMLDELWVDLGAGD